ncbi:putative proteasome subunit beta type-4 [Dictyocoela muelleri]|nr:putative proteasome subunit beta type-4 [Dictyocoela muelleri]
MDTQIAIKGKDFVLMASDASINRSIVRLKNNEDKFLSINGTSVIYNGLQSDGMRICSFAREKLLFENIENDLYITPKTVCAFIQKMIYESLRSSTGPKECSVIVCNHDEIYFIDQYGAMMKDNFVLNGVGSSFFYGVVDKHYQEGMTYDEIYLILKKCLKVLKNRFLVCTRYFYVRVLRENENFDFIVDVEKDV